MQSAIQEFTKDELSQMVKPPFRAKQIYSWLYHKYVTSFDEMKNLPKDLKVRLNRDFQIDILEIVKIENSLDGSRKYLFELKDGNRVEAVLLLMKEAEYHADGGLKHHARYTVCISSQVGCKVGCAFCLTAKSGFTRGF